MPDITGYSEEKRETFVLPTTEGKPKDEQVTVELSFRPPNGADFRLFGEGDDELTQAEKILVSRIVSWNLTENGEPIPVDRVWNILQAPDIKFLVEKIQQNTNLVKSDDTQKKSNLSNSTNTLIA